jgi:2-polyprenyl-3-methyl-5-hydroxy-6-metoxy-1,4-benzoquinol methylase
MNNRNHSGEVIDEANGFVILNCTECRFIHAVVPENNDIYTSHYYDEEKPEYISSNESETAWWDQTYGERLDCADELAGKELLNWIDIGTGPGLFLDAAKKRNKLIVGIEPSSKAAAHAAEKGHEVINGYFDYKLSQKIGTFDAAHFSEVLEHVEDPRDFLNNVSKIVNKDGLIVITVPNDYNVIQNIFTKETGKKKWWLAPPFHINYFSHESLAALVESCGFEVLESTSMFPIDFFLLMGDDYIDNDKIGKEAHRRRKNFEDMLVKQDKNLKRKLYSGFANLGIGREIVLYAKKK